MIMALGVLLAGCASEDDGGNVLFFACNNDSDCLEGFICEPLLDGLAPELSDAAVCRRCTARAILGLESSSRSCLLDSATAPDFEISYECELNPEIAADAVVLTGSHLGRREVSLQAQRSSIEVSTELSPGEAIQFTATASVSSARGAATRPFVHRFRAPVSAGSGVFSSRVEFGDVDALDIASGHLDDDDVLDIVIAHHAAPPSVRFGGIGDGGRGLFYGQHEARAVALGDLDGDGDLDIFFGRSLAEDAVWLGDGAGGAFTAHPQPEFRIQVTLDVELGDLDGDGDLDALTTGPDGSQVWLNDGAATFRPQGSAFGAPEDEDAALGDVDGDGDLDAVLAGSRAVVTLRYNDGAGRFRARSDGEDIILDQLNARDVELEDVDGDGDPDLLVAFSDAPNRVLLNQGLGGFSREGASFGAAAANTLDLVVGDVNGDTTLDLLEITSAQAPQIWLGDGSGGFQTPRRLRLEATPLSASGDGQDACPEGFELDEISAIPRCIRSNAGGRAGLLDDIDGDGDLDAVIARAGAHQVWFNEEPFRITGTSDAIDLLASENTARLNQSISAPDDVVLAVEGWVMHSNVSGATFLRYARPRSGGELDLQLPETTPFPGEILTFTYTGDDLVSTRGILADSVSWQQPRVTRANTGTPYLIASLDTSEVGSVRPLDLDGDADLDLIALRRGAEEDSGVSVWENQLANVRPDNAGEIFIPVDDIDARSRFTLADFDLDGDLDLYLATATRDQLLFNTSRVKEPELTPGSLCVMEPDGDLDCGSEPTPGNSLAAAAGDFDNDGYPDVAVLERLTRVAERVIILHNRPDPDDPTRRVLVPSAESFEASGAYELAVGDIDSDGFMDIVVAQQTGRHLLLYSAGRDGGAFRPCNELTSAPGDNRRVFLGDVSGNGHTDIFIYPFLYLNDATTPGRFDVSPVTLNTNPAEFGLIDFTGDGALDVVYRTVLHEVRVYVNSSLSLPFYDPGADIRLDISPLLADDDSLTGLSFGDMNRDGAIDLILSARGREEGSSRILVVGLR